MALEIGKLAENWCKSKGAPAGAFPNPGAGGAGKRPKIGDFRSYPPPNKQKNLQTVSIALEPLLSNYRLVAHFKFFIVGPDQKMALELVSGVNCG